MGVAFPTPVGQQREVVYLRHFGHCVALGAAGSGKTVMAVHRARYLATEPDIGGPTLLVTFNNSLVTYLKSQVGAGNAVDVEQYHMFAKKHLERDASSRLRVCDNGLRRTLIAQALADVRRNARHTRAVLDRPVDFFVDEFDWLAGHGVTDFAVYLSGELRRTGRGVSLAPADRAVAHRVYERYRELLVRRHDQDWHGIAGDLRHALITGEGPRPYRHVVIDEGQDFSPEMIRSLVAAVPEDGSVTFFGDYAQQIYGRRLSWQSLGLLVVGSGLVRFDRNYRNTRQIADLAKAISDMPHFADGVDLVSSRPPESAGMTPTLVRVGSKTEQIAEAARFANNLLFDRRSVDRRVMRRVAVLLRTSAFDKELVRRLGDSRRVIRLHKGMKTWVHGPGIFYGLFADARGLEFDAVVMPLCDDDELPAAAMIEALGADEATARQARELYVGVTRARADLVILHSGPLTKLLPDEMTGLYGRLED